MIYMVFLRYVYNQVSFYKFKNTLKKQYVYISSHWFMFKLCPAFVCAYAHE